MILDVARRAGAEAIHPGYGFLSENAGFSRACEAAGVIFVGPTAETIEAMGSKSRAKDLMAKAGVPLSPGYQGEDQSPQTFAREAARIGYPVLLKATAGGGGKGMRIVREKSELEGELQSAKREAVSAFGDDRFLVEKFLEGPRHLEVQVFGDGRGGVVHLFERDCSVQRRYQKVIEEAPAPRLPTEVRERLLSAGVEAARAVSYRGAGTVEFLYDGRENVYFMEMNTRLQEMSIRGHAVEARLYAEDPSRGYLPSTGTLTTLSLPRGRGVRIDAGVKQGGEVTPYYDPMIAKVIGHGTDRAAALSALAGALSGVRVEGVTTNAAFLHAIVTNQAFAEGGVTTRFLEAEGRDAAEARKASPTDLALAALWLSLSDGSAFRLNGPRRVRSVFEGEEPVPVSLEEEAPRRWTGMAGAEAVALDEVSVSPRGVTALEGGARLSAKLSGSGGGVVLAQKGPLLALRLHDPLARAGAGAADAASLLSPMPATVTNVLVEAGQAVEAGTPLLTIEAMKMEHVVKAPKDGKVTELPFGKGDSVKEGAALVGFEAG